MWPDKKYKPGIAGIGYYVPDHIMTNHDLEATVKNFNPQKAGRSLDTWVKERYGISERRVSKEETASHQAYRAGVSALSDAGMSASDLDFLILNTSSGDYIQPTTASTVQKLLGMRQNTFAMEINLPCGGPMFGISTAVSFLLSGKYKCGLVIGVDKMFSIIDGEDFKMASLFGEGAGAVIISQDAPHPVLDFYLASAAEEGEEKDYALTILAGGSKYPASEQTISKKDHFLRMNGAKVELFAENAIMESVNILLKDAEIPIDSIDYFIPHQAARTIISRAFDKLGVSPSRVLYTLDRYGNTSAASVLITFAHYKDLYRRDQKLILTAMGAGLNWGGILLQW
jgi:3-oxoacyl-[acyl-carrier-protein] synthase-3